jgi:hypothetical protein
VSSRTTRMLEVFLKNEKGGQRVAPFQRINMQLPRVICSPEGQWRVVGQSPPIPSVVEGGQRVVLFRRIKEQLQSVLCYRDGQCWVVGRPPPRPSVVVEGQHVVLFRQINMQLPTVTCYPEDQWRVTGRPPPRPSVVEAKEDMPSRDNLRYEDGVRATRGIAVHSKIIPKQSGLASMTTQKVPLVFCKHHSSKILAIDVYLNSRYLSSSWYGTR